MSDTNTKNITYINRNFTDFKQNLVNFTQIYFPDIYQDFNEADPGTMLMELFSYVGDTLSLYTDLQLKEMLLPYSQDLRNVIALARTLGYKPKISVPATTIIDIFQLVPSKYDTTSGSVTFHQYIPDSAYIFKIAAGLQVQSTTGINFICNESIDFSISTNDNPITTTVYSLDNSNNPVYFLLKKQASVISATVNTVSFVVSQVIPYNTFTITDTNIIGVYDVIDANGNYWYEVPFLAQDTISTEQVDSQGNYLWKLMTVPNRFVTRVTPTYNLEMQFGAGSVNYISEEVIPNPDNIGLPDQYAVNSYNNFNTIDPYNFLNTNAYGNAASVGTYTVRYLTGGGIQSNVPSNTITKIINANITPSNGSTANLQVFNTLKQSLSINNSEPATGGRGAESIDEIKNNTYALFQAQSRAVSTKDYIARCYAMPSKFGSIAKAYIVQDIYTNMVDTLSVNSNPLALNLYILGYNNLGQLTILNNTVKKNLISYLGPYKMETDAINIRDAFIINYTVKFEIRVSPKFNGNEVLTSCIATLRTLLDIKKWSINQPIIIGDLVSALLNSNGVQSVISIRIQNVHGNIAGNQYSNNYYDIDSATAAGIIYPSKDPSIFELRYPNSDITGKFITN